MGQIKNLTPHVVTVISGDQKANIQPEETPARVDIVENVEISTVAVGGIEVPIVATGTGAEIAGLPDEEDGVTLIVSSLVYKAAGGREDLVIPHQTVRDNDGRPIGCRSFARPF